MPEQPFAPRGAASAVDQVAQSVGRPGRWISKVRAGGPVRNKACYVAFGVNLEGERDVLGLSSPELRWRQVSQDEQDLRTLAHRGAACKLVYLLESVLMRSWRRTYNWSAARLSFKIHFGDRLP